MNSFISGTPDFLAQPDAQRVVREMLAGLSRSHKKSYDSLQEKLRQHEALDQQFSELVSLILPYVDPKSWAIILTRIKNEDLKTYLAGKLKE